MVWSRRVLKLGAIALLGTTLSGCIVLPYGAGHGPRRGHLAAPSQEHPAMQAPAPQYRRSH
ncbi:MAG: hypothetical protein C0505_07085 [Leptothrix sp. (in: Bacteria)]|nr:hypothetical protein [Leptothrix sp. (in: b-proteobacteria)]